MLTRKPTVLFAVLAALVLAVIAACGGGQTSSPARVDSSAVSGSAANQAPAQDAGSLTSTPLTKADLVKIAHEVFKGPHAEECGRDRSTCPITGRLEARIIQLTTPAAGGPGPVAPFCRCQNGAQSMSVTPELTRNGGIAHVTLDYGPPVQSKIDLVVVTSNDRPLVDDTQCTGRGPSTSIYTARLAGCDTPVSVSCTSSGPASASFGPPESLPQSGPPPIVSAAAAGDTFTVTFGSGTPRFEVAQQPTANFTLGPSGRPLTLPGSAGATITLRGFRGDRSNLSAVPQSISSNGSFLRQVRATEDFEGVVTFAAGLSAPGCANVSANGSTLAFHFVPVGGRG
jgi:hypothetical protein